MISSKHGEEVSALPKELRSAVSRGILALLMASGLILTLLCVTGESSLWALALGTSLPVIALLSSLRTRPGGKVLAAGITAAGVIVWLIAGGAADAVEVIQALLLHFRD